MSDSWVSRETERKEDDFRGIMQMHVLICKGIIGRHDGPPYLYADLFAGPGSLEYKGRCFDGSPLIVRDILVKSGLEYLALHYEQDTEVAARLAECLWEPATLLDLPNADTAPIYAVPCQQGFADWLDQHGADPTRHGLVYSDPIKDEIPHELLNKAAHHLPKVDLLSYVSATQYKRRHGTDEAKPRLQEHIAAVDKRFVLIREPLGAWQWTFVLWSNWPDMPAWEKRGFHRLDSPRGQKIMEYLNLSKPELHAKYNQPLFGSNDAA